MKLKVTLSRQVNGMIVVNEAECDFDDGDKTLPIKERRKDLDRRVTKRVRALFEGCVKTVEQET